MKLQINNGPLEQIQADALAFVCFEKENAESSPLPVRQNGWLQELRDSGEFAGKLYELSWLHRPAGLAAKRLVVMGGGSRDKFTAVEARRLAGVLLRSLRPKGVRSLALVLENADDDLVCAVAEGAVLGEWESDKHKTDPKKEEKKLELFTLATAGGSNTELAFERGRIIAEAQNLSRELVNEPANLLSPEKLADAAREVSKRFGLECDVLDRDQMTKLGMGALLGVAQGSDNPPFLIVMKYQPEEKGADHLALVGKGVTSIRAEIPSSRPTAWNV